MKLREIKEVGFYRKVNDIDRKTIYEVIENTDEDWLKEDPEATLLIDTWLYDYTDENDRAIYFTDGNLLSVYFDESNIDVVKIEDTKYKVFGKYGLLLIEDKPTYEKQLQRKTAECEELRTKLNERILDSVGLCSKITSYKLNFEGARGALQALIRKDLTDKKLVEYYANIALRYLSFRSDIIERKTPDKYEAAIEAILELVEENKNTPQYRGICRSILDITNKIGRR